MGTTTPTLEEIRCWSAVVPLWADEGPCAGRALGISRQTTYQLARQNALPFTPLRLGRQLRVVLADLLQALGQPNTSEHSEGRE
jgi:excisionase family DNA binding protein